LTLVVALLINNEIFVVADTKFTTPHEGKPLSSRRNIVTQAEQYFGGLKVIILFPGLFVAFANEISFAKAAIEKIYDKKINLINKDRAIDYFFDQHCRSQSQTDFILGFICNSDDSTENFEKEIVKISEGYIERGKNVAYIGDKDAFTKFQNYSLLKELKHPSPNFTLRRLGKESNPDFQQNLVDSIRAIDQVIRDPEIPTVDGICTTLTSENDEFRYTESVEFFGKPIPIKKEPNSSVYFGGAAEGSDNRQIGAYLVPGVGVFSVFLDSGKFGVIYNPVESFNPEVFHCNSMEEFAKLIKERTDKAIEKIKIYQESQLTQFV
jgi:hypothetical protein